MLQHSITFERIYDHKLLESWLGEELFCSSSAFTGKDTVFIIQG